MNWEKCRGKRAVCIGLQSKRPFSLSRDSDWNLVRVITEFMEPGAVSQKISLSNESVP